MSFPTYAHYKDSGVEWLGEVPAHWTLPKLKHIANFSGGGTPSRDNLDFWGGNIPWVSPKDMKVERIEGAEENITDIGLSNSTASLIPAGALLMVVRSGILKHTVPVAINTVEVALNQDMKALRFAKDRASSKFFLRWVQGLNDLLLLEWAKQGATVESIEQTYLAETVIPLPPLPEQETITTFLDYETTKLDALIAEQRTLIDLLKEKRQAVISHAVTKGLDPRVPMKDSGVEWLGAVPAHWDIVPAKRVSSIFVPQRNKPELNADGDGFFWVTMDQMRNDVISASELFVSESAVNDAAIRVLPAGAVVASCVGTFGLAAINVVDVVINQQLQAFVPTDDIDPKFLRYCVLIAEVYFNQIGTSATITYVNQLGFANMPLPLPTRGEQQQIVERLASESIRIDLLVSEAVSTVALLTERRSALISAAVTGKIDVRQHTTEAA